MPEDSEFERLEAEYLAKGLAWEADKRMLYDRTIGGERVPRPSLQYIEECVGPLKSEREIRADARAASERELQRNSSQDGKPDADFFKEQVQRIADEQKAEQKRGQHQDPDPGPTYEP